MDLAKLKLRIEEALPPHLKHYWYEDLANGHEFIWTLGAHLLKLTFLDNNEGYIDSYWLDHKSQTTSYILDMENADIEGIVKEIDGRLYG